MPPPSIPKPACTPKRPLAHTFAILALWFIFYGSFTLITPALLDDADSVHAEVAREMLLRHDFVTLYANGIRYLEKAPLLYWAMAICMGASQLAHHTSAAALTAAARIPLALTVLALAFAVETFARRSISSARAGLYAALILLSSPGLFLFTRITIPDAMLTLWLTLALFAFWLTEHSSSTSTIIENAATDRSVILNEVKHPRISHLQLPVHANQSVPQDLRLPAYLFATCCALAVLTKGLIGLLFPVAIVTIHLLLTRGARATLQRLRQLHPITSLAIFLAIAAPWHILIALANPTQGHPANLTFSNDHWQVPLPTDGNVHGWAWFYFLNEHLLRYLNLRVPHDYDTVPLTLFLGLILIWLMPWSIFLFQALTQATRSALAAIASSSKLKAPQLKAHPSFLPQTSHATQSHRDGITPESRTHLLLLLWAAIPLLFFSFSTRQEYYVLPSLPPLAILIAFWLSHKTITKSEAEKHRRSAYSCTAVLAIVGLCFAVGSLDLILHTHRPTPNTDLAALLQQNPADYAMSMGHFLDLNAKALALFRLPLALAAAALFLGPLTSYLLRRANRPHSANLALAAGAFAFLLAAHQGLRTFAPILSSQQLAAALAPHLQPGDLLVIHQEYEYASTLGFYLQRPNYRFQPVRLSPPQTTPPTDHDRADIAIRPIPVNPIHILTDPTYNGTPNYGRSSNLWYGSFFPDAPPIFETPQTLATKWRTPQRIFLWQDLANQPSPPPALTPIYVIARSGGKQILSNQPNQ